MYSPRIIIETSTLEATILRVFFVRSFLFRFLVPASVRSCISVLGPFGRRGYLRRTLVDHYEWLGALSLMMREREFKVTFSRCMLALFFFLSLFLVLCPIVWCVCPQVSIESVLFFVPASLTC